MKILIAGHWSWYQYEESFSIALKELGYEVIQFNTSNYFKGKFGKIQQKLPFIGPALIKINYDLIKIIKKEKPKIFLSWACTHILPYTFKKINNSGILTVTYNNDDPFAYKLNNHSPWNHYFYWHWYLKNLRVSQKNFFYRSINIVEAKKYGANHADILKPYFIQWKDYPIHLNNQEIEKLTCDLVFIGHYEPDNRVNYLRCLVQSNLKVKLYGGKYWTKEVLGNMFENFHPILPVYGSDYTKALSGAKICLVFLSKINRDIEVASQERDKLEEGYKKLRAKMDEFVEKY